MHNHLEEGQGGYLDILEEVRVLVPGLGRQQRLRGQPTVLIFVLHRKTEREREREKNYESKVNTKRRGIKFRC